MKKLFKKSASLLMVLMMMLSNGTVAVNAAPDGRIATLLDLNVEVTQNGAPIAEGGQINSGDPIDLLISFNVPVEGDTLFYPERADDAYFAINEATEFLVSTGFEVTSGMGKFKLEVAGSVIGYLELIQVDDKVSAHVVFADSVVDDIIVSPEVFGGTVHDVDITFSTTLQYDDSEADVNGENFEITLLNKTYNLDIPEVPTIVTSTKSGDINGLFIDWTVTYNVIQDSVNLGLEDYIFEDDLSQAGTYVRDTFKINDTLTTIDNDEPLMVDPSISYALTGLTSPIVIKYQTVVSEDDYYSSVDETFTNSSNLRKDADIVVNSYKETNVTFVKNWIDKGGSLTASDYTAELPEKPTATFVWTINANSLGASLNNVYIRDVIDEHLIVTDARYFIGDSTIPNIIWSDATDLVLDPTTTQHPLSEIARNNEVVPVIPGGEYSLGSVNDKIKIIITTDVIWNAVSYDFGHNVYSMDNSATIEWSNYGGGSVSSTTGDIGFGINPINKSVISSDKKNHTIDWKLTVSESNLNNNLRVLDLLVYGDTFNTDINDTVVTIDNNTAGGLTDVTFDNISKTNPQFGQRYFEDGVDANITLHTLRNDAGVAIADLLVFTNAGSEIDVASGSKTFSFKSQLTNPDDYASNASTYIYNNATLFTTDLKLNSVNRSYNYVSNMLKKDMLKVGDSIAVDADSAGINEAFNYIDKSVVFRLTINSNELSSLNSYTDLTNIKVTDTFPDGWDIVDITTGNKFLIYDAAGNDVTAASVDETTGFLTASFIDATDTDPSKAIFDFSDLDKKYIIFIKAELDEDTELEYFNDNITDVISNLATFEADLVTLTVSDTQSISISSEIISKEYSNETDGELLWSVEYKPYELEFTGVEIEDVLPVGLDLRTNSLGELDLSDGNFAITKLLLNNDGSYTDDGAVDVIVDENIKYDNATRTLTFIIPEIGQAYRFNYLTDINANTNVELTNSVSLKNAGGSPSSVLAAYTVSRADVTATMSRSGWVQVNKIDNNSAPLGNARFGIYTEDGITLFRSGYTTVSGELLLRGLPDGNYILKEIEAPANHKKSTKVYSVVVSTIDGVVTTSVNDQTGEDSNLITFINFETGDTGDLKITKLLTGSAPDYTKDFTFTIEIADLNESYDYIGSGGKANGTITFVNGKASFTLQGGESIIIQYLPKDLDYSVSENDYYGDPADRYSTSSINASGVIVVDDTVNVQFTNQKHALIYDDYGTLPDTGDDFPSNLLISFLGISFLGAMILLLIKKKKFGN
jgi:LPXTG-motif cell wall-anchored protein